MKHFLLSTLCALFACLPQAHAQTQAFSRLPSGTEYRLYRKDATGQYQSRTLAATDAPYATRAGKVLTVFLEFRTGRDSVLMNSRRMQPLPQPVALPPQPTSGGMEEAIGLLLPGDSAIFRFPADTIFSKTFRQPVPPFVKKSGNTLVVLASAHELLTMDEIKVRQEKMQAEYAKQAEVQAAAQKGKDDAIIQAYLKKNHATARKTPGGTYYIIKKVGTGLPPKKGQTVRVLYRGTILTTGQEFDSSAKHQRAHCFSVRARPGHSRLGPRHCHAQ